MEVLDVEAAAAVERCGSDLDGVGGGGISGACARRRGRRRQGRRQDLPRWAPRRQRQLLPPGHRCPRSSPRVAVAPRLRSCRRRRPLVHPRHRSSDPSFHILFVARAGLVLPAGRDQPPLIPP